MEVCQLKSYNHLFERMLDKDFIRQNIIDAAKHKHNRPDVKKVLRNLEWYVDYVYTIIKDETFRIHSKPPIVIHESTCKKPRVILRPDFMPDLVIQHMIVKILQPILQKHFYYNSCASIPGKGPEYGRKSLCRFIRRNQTKPMYVFKCDIRKFFEHIDRDILMNMFVKRIHDYRFLKLIHILIYYNEGHVGVPLGFYSSQWFANFYLTSFDYYVKQYLHLPFVMRYMDDIVMIDFNKRRLRSKSYVMKQYLMDLKLTLKRDFQLFKFDEMDHYHNNPVGRCIDYMGFKFYRTRITLRKRTLTKLQRKTNKLFKRHLKGLYLNWYMCTQLLSRLGSLTHVHCYKFFHKHLQYKINVKQLRNTVSEHSKYLNEHSNLFILEGNVV